MEDNFLKGFIYQLSFPFAAPVLFVKKPDGGLRFCINDWNINSKNIQNRCPLQFINKMLNDLGKGHIYMKLGIRGAYNIIHVKERD